MSFNFSWSKPQRRCFQRLKTGFHWHNNEILRFLTLGSIPDMHKDISSCYTDLYKRIRRLTPLKLLTTGYITKRQLRLQYANVPLNQRLKFDYIKIKTSEGAEGVLHILYFGDFLPQEWLKNNWCEITNGCNSAYIKMCRTPVYNEKRLAGYCIDQYCINQNNNDGGTSFLRYSWSSGWAYGGFAKDWEFHKWLYKNDQKNVLYYTWNIWLERCKNMSQPLLQTNLGVVDT
jgi:hypothetical protein